MADNVKVLVVTADEKDVLRKLGEALGVDLEAQINEALGNAGVDFGNEDEDADECDCGGCDVFEDAQNYNFGELVEDECKDNDQRQKFVIDVGNATNVEATETEDGVTVAAEGSEGEYFEDTFVCEDGSEVERVSVYWKAGDSVATVRLFKRKATLKAGRWVRINAGY